MARALQDPLQTSPASKEHHPTSVMVCYLLAASYCGQQGRTLSAIHSLPDRIRYSPPGLLFRTDLPFCPLITLSWRPAPLPTVLLSLPRIRFSRIHAWLAPHFPRVSPCANITASGRSFLLALDEAAVPWTPGGSLSV